MQPLFWMEVALDTVLSGAALFWLGIAVGVLLAILALVNHDSD